MADVKRMYGEFESQPEQDGSAVLTGRCPVAEMKEYPVEVASYTKGRGRIFCTPGGYAPCHNAEEVIENIGYDPERKRSLLTSDMTARQTWKTPRIRYFVPTDPVLS